jgi:DNA-binding CsgD family transcriptional regulator
MVGDQSLIDSVYEASVIAEKWPNVLMDLSARHRGNGGALFVITPSGAQRWTVSPDLRPQLEEFLRDGWAELNQRPARLAKLNYNGFANDLDVFTPEEIEADPVYSNFYPSRDMGWAAGTMIPVPSGDTLVFSFERAFRKGPFEDHELIALDALRPHLARAALLSSRLELQRAQAMTAALEIIGLPAAVLRKGGRLYAANPSFERLIPSVVQDRHDRLILCDPGADKILADTLQRLDVAEAEGQSRSIPIPPIAGSVPMITHVTPVRGSARDIFSQSLALLLITPVDRNSVPTAEVLQGLFDLTPAEARVARGIAEGKTVDAISLTYGTSRETVRKQLAAVLGKSGVSRQAELVALLSGTGMTEAADE